jgi:hypothetical protein
MNRRRYRSLMLKRAGRRPTPPTPRRISSARSPRGKNRPHPPRPTGRDRRVAIGLTLAILSFPLLASCDRTPKGAAPIDPLRSNTVPNKVDPTKPAPPARPGRTITFQGLDNDFRGSTTVLPDNQVIHHKESP